VSNKPLPIAQRMESHENHNVVLEHIMKLFTKGLKLSQKNVRSDLLNEYKERLENKDEVHAMILEQYKQDKMKHSHIEEIEDYNPD